jgi:hypothetical protein
MEIPRLHSDKKTCDWLWHYSYEVIDQPLYSPDLVLSDFQIFGTLKK